MTFEGRNKEVTRGGTLPEPVLLTAFGREFSSQSGVAAVVRIKNSDGFVFFTHSLTDHWNQIVSGNRRRSCIWSGRTANFSSCDSTIGSGFDTVFRSRPVAGTSFLHRLQ